MRSLIIALIALAMLFFWLFRETQQNTAQPQSREEKREAFINELKEIDKSKVEKMLFEGSGHEDGDKHPQDAASDNGSDESQTRKPDQAEDLGFEQALRELKTKLPDVYAIREYAKENPHTTPPQFFEFSKALAPLMEQALKDKKKAVDLFSELEFCAADSKEVPSTIQSVCLQNMSRLAGAFEAPLKDRFSDAKSQSSQAARDFLMLME